MKILASDTRSGNSLVLSGVPQDTLYNQVANVGFSFLRRISNGQPFPIEAQLRERRITHVVFAPYVLKASLTFGKDGNFLVLIEENGDNRSKALKLGEFVAQTFHFNLTKTPPTDYFPSYDADVLDEFCRTFGELWVDANGLQKIEESFRNNTIFYKAGILRPDFSADFP